MKHAALAITYKIFSFTILQRDSKITFKNFDIRVPTSGFWLNKMDWCRLKLCIKALQICKRPNSKILLEIFFKWHVLFFNEATTKQFRKKWTFCS